MLTLDEAVDVTRTGDLWVFRGRSFPDRAIQTVTNSPVNHVGMAIVVEDLPAMMWHAELGMSLVDLWSGTHHRGVQLHDLRDAVLRWGNRYGQRGWLRQLEPEATAEMEDAALRTVARLDGTPFPSTARLAGRWARGRLPRLRRGTRDAGNKDAGTEGGSLESAYCAEVAAITYEAMGLLPSGRRAGWYDPGKFWSGDDLDLLGGHLLGTEIAIDIPPTTD